MPMKRKNKIMIKRLHPNIIYFFGLTFSACDWRRFGSCRGVGMSGTISRYSNRRSRARMCGLESNRMSSNSCKAKHWVDLWSLGVLASSVVLSPSSVLRSLYFSICLSFFSVYQSIYFCIYPYISICLSACLTTHLSIYQTVYRSIYLTVYMLI